MRDFNIDINDEGTLSGWCDANSDGIPAEIKFHLHDCHPEALPVIYCSNTRKDVQDSGRNLLVGFDVIIASDCNLNRITATIEDEEFSVYPNPKDSSFQLIIDQSHNGKIEGWVDAPEPPFSLIISNGEFIQFAEFYVRPDLEIIKGKEWKKSGFRVNNFLVDEIRWFILNNKFLRVLRA